MAKKNAKEKQQEKKAKVIPIKKERPKNILDELSDSLKSIQEKLDYHYGENKKEKP